MKNLIVIVLFSLISFQSLAIEGVYKIIIQKEEKKRSNRWSLSDWMLTKKKIALQDQWLALNSDSPWVEVYFEGMQGDLENTRSDLGTTVENEYERISGGFFIKFLGISGGSETFSTTSESDFAQVNLLLLGSTIQGSHIMLHGGQRDLKWDETSNFDQSYYGGSIVFYLLPFLGVEGIYRKYAEETSDIGNITMESTWTELSAFIDVFI